MDNRFVIAISIVAIAIAMLVYGAVNASAKSVVTVAELNADGKSRSHIRLGARVAEGEITFVTAPKPEVSFLVRDIEQGGPSILVVYQGMMPDTLKVGRDVILEGDFADGKFSANVLLTQCPSKYVPPAPGGTAPTGAISGEAAALRDYAEHHQAAPPSHSHLSSPVTANGAP